MHLRSTIKNALHCDKKVKVKGTVVLMKKNTLDLTDLNASIADGLCELFRCRVSFQLVSSTVGDPNRENRGKVGKAAYLEHWLTTVTSITADESKFNVTFDWDNADGIPGAVIVKNSHASEFFIKTLTLENFPTKGRIHFVCNSWVYPAKEYKYDRIFFSNDTYLPSQTPEPLKPYRNEALIQLRGDGVNREYRECDRVYAYDYYNDVGDPGYPELARPLLGGSKEYPYPRRGRTGRPPARADPKMESRVSSTRKDVYVPRDERFGHLKMSDFLGYAVKSVVQSLKPTLRTLVSTTPFEFGSFQDVLNMYEGGIKLPKIPVIEDMIPLELIKELVRTDGERLLKLPVPQVIADNKTGWRTDQEFAREMVAGVNPVIIRRLEEFPPRSKLDPVKYGDQNSSITAAHIEKNTGCFTVEQAMQSNRLFILDYHDMIMPFLNRINSHTYKIAIKTLSNKVYATRTILFLKDDGTLKPLAIELSLPHPNGEQHGAISQVYTPAEHEHEVEASLWHLAKAYVVVNDSGIHQIISHWLHTHAVIEPFVIATNRQLSIMHPVHKLLSPHYRDTMNINAQARQVLINAGGLMELTMFPGKYVLELSSASYKNWKFTEQAHPADLLKRGVAVEDPTQPNNIRLLIEDYPFAVDGLAIWFAIKNWVSSYCAIYYLNDAAMQADTELQAWWKEVRDVGHGDKKDEPWWPKMQTVAELVESCTTIIWICSALHAAVNFGQYPYGGYLPNRPTLSRLFMPQPGTKEYDELKRDPDGVFLKTIASQFQGILGVSLIEILSRHSSDEVYLGQRDTPEWTSDQKALQAFKEFGDRLMEIERKIMSMNEDESLKNRSGPVKMPYTLLYPNTSDYSRVGGLTGRGVPNSISI